MHICSYKYVFLLLFFKSIHFKLLSKLIPSSSESAQLLLGHILKSLLIRCDQNRPSGRTLAHLHTQRGLICESLLDLFWLYDDNTVPSLLRTGWTLVFFCVWVYDRVGVEFVTHTYGFPCF